MIVLIGRARLWKEEPVGSSICSEVVNRFLVPGFDDDNRQRLQLWALVFQRRFCCYINHIALLWRRKKWPTQLSWRRRMQNCPHINCRPVGVVNSNACRSIQMFVPAQAQEGRCGWIKLCHRTKRERRRRRRRRREKETGIELEKNRRHLHGMGTTRRLNNISWFNQEMTFRLFQPTDLPFLALATSWGFEPFNLRPDVRL